MEPEEFEGPALVLGSVRGRRSFGVTADGRLTGLYYNQVWQAGENVAACHHDDGVVVRRPDGGIVVRWSSSREIGAGHGLQGCTCGFYAYYREDPYSRARRISGVVEGYGRVILGTAGFRCEKARILALLLPDAHSGAGEPAPEWRRPDDPTGQLPLDGVTPVETTEVEVTSIRAAYPDVAFFAREEDMLAAHPPTINGPEI
jgi:hypothetical protein